MKMTITKAETATTEPIEIPTKADPQAVIPGSVSADDLDKVFEEFLVWTGWDDPEKRNALQQRRQDRLTKIAKQIEYLKTEEARLRMLTGDIEENKKGARQYLTLAAQRLGTMGSQPVLLTVMRERYPKLAKRASLEVVAPATSTSTSTSSTSSKAAEQPALRPNDQRQKVVDVLDKEGLTMKDIKDACGLPMEAVKLAVAHLVHDQLVSVEGKGATKTYRRVSEST